MLDVEADVASSIASRARQHRLGVEGPNNDWPGLGRANRIDEAAQAITTRREAWPCRGATQGSIPIRRPQGVIFGPAN